MTHSSSCEEFASKKAKKEECIKSGTHVKKQMNAKENDFFFHIDLSLIFHRFWPRFGRSRGGFGRFLAIQNGFPKGKIIFLHKTAILDGF